MKPNYQVVILSSDLIGPQMAGPGIRYLKMAEAVARHWQTTLVVPETVTGLDMPCPWIKNTDPSFSSLLRQAAVIITQGYNFPLKPLLLSPARLIIDLYDPVPFEILGLASQTAGDPEQLLLYDWTLRKTNLLLAHSDFFLCATQRQRSLWLGYLLALGKINPGWLATDPHFERLLTIVPFGIEDTPFPRVAQGAMRHQIPGLGAEDVIFFWGGGLWDWLDPMIAIRAVHQAVPHNPRIKLVFLAGRHPNPAIPEMNTAALCRDLARETGLLDQHVFFIKDWIPYAERHRYLADADVGISFHRTSLEAEYSFRTRVLDYLWAGLPVLLSEGDELSEAIENTGAGLCVKSDDEENLVSQMLRMAESLQFRQQMSAAAAALASHYGWGNIMKKVTHLVRATREAPVPKTGKATRYARLACFYVQNMMREFNYLGGAKGLAKLAQRFRT